MAPELVRQRECRPLAGSPPLSSSEWIAVGYFSALRMATTPAATSGLYSFPGQARRPVVSRALRRVVNRVIIIAQRIVRDRLALLV
jgi:hypothetical protein